MVFNGMPQWTPIPGTQLSYPANSDSTVLKYTPTGAFYFLTSGRWFTTTHPVMGTWTEPRIDCHPTSRAGRLDNPARI